MSAFRNFFLQRNRELELLKDIEILMMPKVFNVVHFTNIINTDELMLNAECKFHFQSIYPIARYCRHHRHISIYFRLD